MQVDALTVIDASLSSALIILLLVVALLSGRDARHTAAGPYLVALCLSVSALIALAHPLATTFQQTAQVILTIIAAPNLGLMWAFCLTLLNDGARLPRWTIAGVGLLAIVPLLIGLTQIGLIADVTQSLGQLTLMPPLIAGLHLGWVAVSEYRGDLVESRRKARFIIVALLVAVSLISILSEDMGDSRMQSIVRSGLIGLPSVVLGLLWLLRLHAEKLAFVSVPARAANRPVDPRDQHVVQRLNLMMRDEKAFLSPDLSIERLAQRLDVPVHRLRAIINTALGHRNVAAFVNGYRIDFAKAALADPARGRETVLAIAYEAGFASLQTFNRVFRDMVDMTPTDYRSAHLANPPISENLRS